MAEYTIEAVAKEIREYSSKFGPMKSYKVKLSGELDPVEISQKDTTPAPVAGEKISGTITDTEYGKKFKKEYNPQGGSTQGGFRGGSKPSGSDFTMYLSYAKDLVVAHVTSETKSTLSLEDSVAATLQYGHMLYEGRPDAPKATPEAKVSEDKAEDSEEDLTLEMPEDWLK